MKYESKGQNFRRHVLRPVLGATAVVAVVGISANLPKGGETMPASQTIYLAQPTRAQGLPNNLVSGASKNETNGFNISAKFEAGGSESGLADAILAANGLSQSKEVVNAATGQVELATGTYPDGNIDGGQTVHVRLNPTKQFSPSALTQQASNEHVDITSITQQS